MSHFAQLALFQDNKQKQNQLSGVIIKMHSVKIKEPQLHQKYQMVSQEVIMEVAQGILFTLYQDIHGVPQGIQQTLRYCKSMKQIP
ncbi:unnamed protein product (macronuclear) [Paramecium tetraurelia]|uniref:Uncharacterized protein n=1 Tax=Paramecium tetraurelia TaxID=5888 RepID=A0DP31_PARTE|nr:uncharacterized protein GSPATT00039706001 [Paramecium tetraurelia]CAK84798.1 unnamed protein product [Paramecium tetraurelia]|eukprot:XP_001452195.1 hypothetical protein (macronuclear) [Paramecium tetraurelia strain d4-2]